MLISIFVKLAGTLSIISELSQQMAEILQVHSDRRVIVCLGHFFGNMFIGILAGSIAQPIDK